MFCKNSFKLFILLVSLICLFGCKHPLVDPPTSSETEKKNPADYADEILPPKEVFASNGLYRKIKINWTPVENAIDYALYYANTPFDTFTQIAETTDTEYEIESAPGTNYCFSVVAINYFGTHSTKSMIATGSSLATPIITQIANDSPTSFTISWWMDNCNNDTYQKNTDTRTTEFHIFVYNKDKELLSDYTKTESGSSRSTTIEDILSSSKYWFRVEAEVKILNEDGTFQENKTEISDYVDKESAHKVTPEKAADFRVTQGTDTNTILSWTLPQMVWTKNGTNWNLNPVFFSVLRKPTDSNEDFAEIASIGSIPEPAVTNYKDYTRYQFDCLTNKVYDTKTLTEGNPTEISFISIECGEPVEGETKSAYTSNSKITFTDESAERGVKYQYLIRSYPDFIADAKKYSDETSLSEEVTGWSIAQPTLYVKEFYDTTENSINKVNITFNSSNFNDLGVEYKYLITRINNDAPETEEIVYFGGDFQSAEDNFSSPGSAAEYFRYNLYILSGNTSAPVSVADIQSSYLEHFESKKIVTVINNLNNLPVLDNFLVDDGYKNKFVIECDAKDNVSYELIAIPFQNGNEGTSTTVTAVFINNKFDFAANSGDAFKFILRATLNKGTGNEVFREVSLPETYYTLGSPDISLTSYEYDSITVTWPLVQMAKSDVSEFVVSAKYQTSAYPEDTGELINSSNTEITYNADKKIYTCVISRPSGYNISYISGKPINLTISAVSSKHIGEESETTEIVRTLGPAEIITETTFTPAKKQVSVSWSPAVGAEKYLVYRILYGDKAKTDENIIGEDKLVVDVSSLTVDGGQDNDGRSTIAFNPNAGIFKYILTDIQKDASESYGYQLNQEHIQWGYPIDYVIFPLKVEDSANSINFTYRDEKTTFSDSSHIAYEEDCIKTRKVERCTFGYGFDVHAAKSESGSKITVTWEKPNNIYKSVSIFRKEFHKEADYDYGSDWEYLTTKDSNVTTYNDYIPADKSHLAFVYAIQYDTTSDFVKSYRTSEAGLCLKESHYGEKYSQTNKPIEPSNKGYLFSITDVKAQSIEETYKELISWNSTWDFEERALCPKSFYIQIKNKNISASKDWLNIAKVDISPTGTFTFDKSFALPAANTYDLDVDTDSIGEVGIRPKSFIDNASPKETNGLLKVLRDTRHYYSFYITQDGISYDRQFEDESLFTYREITETELIKCVNVIIADALYQASIPNETGAASSGATNNCHGYDSTGVFSITHKAWENSCTWGFNGQDYRHTFKSLPTDHDERIASDFILNAETATAGSEFSCGIYGARLYYLPALDIKVSHKSGLKSYECKKFSFEAGAQQGRTLGYPGSATFNLYIKLNNTSKVSYNSNYDEYIKWFPYYLNNDISASPITTYDTNCPLYIDPWWN